MRKLILKLLGVDKQMKEMSAKFYALSDLVWNHGRFEDNAGNVIDYNKDEVLYRWNTYHELNQEFKKIERG
jgi:hypothetical protein